VEKRFGWIPDVPDQRDFYWRAPKRLRLPPAMDLRPLMPEIYDQGELGSCTANAVGGLCEFVDKSIGDDPYFTPSRLFVYYNTRVIEGTVKYDSGATIRNTIKAIARQGFPPEKIWPYRIERLATKPSKSCYTKAKKEIITQYSRVDRSQLREALASKLPVAFGFAVYDSFMSDDVARSGDVPMPLAGESLLGGHAVLLVGYDEPIRKFWVRNSWGPTWGKNGYFQMPYDYVWDPNLSDDFWTVKFVP